MRYSILVIIPSIEYRTTKFSNWLSVHSPLFPLGGCRDIQPITKDQLILKPTLLVLSQVSRKKGLIHLCVKNRPYVSIYLGKGFNE